MKELSKQAHVKEFTDESPLPWVTVKLQVVPRNEKDRRATFVRLTNKGLRLFEVMAAAHERWVNEILGSFSDERSETMVGLLDALREETHTGVRSP